VAWAFTTLHTGNWHPLTWLSHMLDVELFALNPAGHHLTSLLLHTANSLLLLSLLVRLTGFLGRSLAVALLFGLHPLHVESVAWVAERKDLLAALFWLLALGAYARYARAPGPGRYLLLTALFVLGLLAKPMVVTLPLVLLLLDVWPHQRPATVPRSRLVAEKLPILALSLASAGVTLFAQRAGGALNPHDAATLPMNIGNALLAYLGYLQKMLWPTRLAVLYPFDPLTVTPGRVAGAAAVLAAVSVLVLGQRQSRPYLAFGWLWYLVTLLPVIGLVRVGAQAMADRYTYLPLIGIFIALVWGGADLTAGLRRAPVLQVTAVALAVAACAVLTRAQLRHWRSSLELFRHTVAVTENNWVAHHNLASDLLRARAVDEAIGHYREALRLNPRYVSAYLNLGIVLRERGELDQAIACFRAAVAVDPAAAAARMNLGFACVAVGDRTCAESEYRELLRLDAPRAEALGDALRRHPPARTGQ
jgi:hypothetical protein